MKAKRRRCPKVKPPPRRKWPNPKTLRPTQKYPPEDFASASISASKRHRRPKVKPPPRRKWPNSKTIRPTPKYTPEDSNSASASISASKVNHCTTYCTIFCN